MKTKINHKYTLPILALLLLITVWEFLPLLLRIPNYIFPRLSEVLKAIIAVKEILITHMSITAAEAVLGFFIGSTLGFITGVCMAQSRVLSKITLPYVIATNAIPVIAIAPIVILWFGHGLISKAIVSAFLCFFPLVINTYKGLNEYDTIYKELFQIYGSSKGQFLIKFKIPHARPYIVSGLKLNATFSVVGAVVAEFIGANAGLGFGMLQASYNLNTPRLWGYIIISCLLGIAMYMCVYIGDIALNKNNKIHKT